MSSYFFITLHFTSYHHAHVVHVVTQIGGSSLGSVLGRVGQVGGRKNSLVIRTCEICTSYICTYVDWRRYEICLYYVCTYVCMYFVLRTYHQKRSLLDTTYNTELVINNICTSYLIHTSYHMSQYTWYTYPSLHTQFPIYPIPNTTFQKKT